MEKIKTFYVVKVINKKELIASIDYPKDFPVPNVGDGLVVKDENGWEHIGIVIKKRFVVRDYRELTITLSINN